MNSAKGLGDHEALINVYISNTPPTMTYQQLNDISPMLQGEISAVGAECGNGWRKVFNVYAKLLFALGSDHYNFLTQASTWQLYRDNYLLQTGSGTALLFSPPSLYVEEKNKPIQIIMGRTYAKQLINQGDITEPLTWLNDEFAIGKQSRIIVCPYFDYRQLSNLKITYLTQLINDFHR
jgi:hypothetical protein